MTDDQQQSTTGDDLANQALASVSTDPEEMGEALTSLQNIIERNANELDRINENLRMQKESLKSVFENDTELSDIEEQAALVTTKVKDRKSKLQGSSQVLRLKTEIGDLTSQKKEIEEALNNHLLNLYKITGTAVFDTSSGDQREFTVRASLKSKKAAKE